VEHPLIRMSRRVEHSSHVAGSGLMRRDDFGCPFMRIMRVDFLFVSLLSLFYRPCPSSAVRAPCLQNSFSQLPTFNYQL
jgi:hypothetical protein